MPHKVDISATDIETEPITMKHPNHSLTLRPMRQSAYIADGVHLMSRLAGVRRIPSAGYAAISLSLF
jgi:hypothetical protein